MWVITCVGVESPGGLISFCWSMQNMNGKPSGRGKQKKSYDNVILSTSIICFMSSICFRLPHSPTSQQWKIEEKSTNFFPPHRSCFKLPKHTWGETYCFRHFPLRPLEILKKERERKKHETRMKKILYLCIIWFFAFFASSSFALESLKSDQICLDGVCADAMWKGFNKKTMFFNPLQRTTYKRSWRSVSNDFRVLFWCYLRS